MFWYKDIMIQSSNVHRIIIIIIYYCVYIITDIVSHAIHVIQQNGTHTANIMHTLYKYTCRSLLLFPLSTE